MPFRYIFQIKVHPGKDAAFRESWHNGSIPIQKMPGACGTRLHTKLGEEGTYIAIAEWESKAARVAALAELDKPDNPLGQEMRRWGENEDFGEVTLIAEVDEIDHVVLPATQSRLRLHEVTPKAVYDAAVRVINRRHSLSMGAVSEELNAPAFSGWLAVHSEPEIRLRKAYFAAKAGRPYPVELDDPDSDPFKLSEIY